MFSLYTSLVFCQREGDSIVLKVDKEQVLTSRSLSELNETYNGEEFNYDVNEGEAQNLLARAINWFFDLLKNTFGIDLPPEAFRLLEYLIYILMAALVIYLLVKFFIGEKFSSIFSKKATTLLDINLSEEHIENLDLDALLQSALVQKDYRLAIRFQYLKTLKLLSQKNIIDWHYEKTNLDYQREIQTPKIRSLFTDVSYLYDYIWYGEQELDETKYNAADIKFTALKTVIPQ
ncbi:DUF4129 domain-containing protein [Costertonia aggregata]|uniref:Protein-glutamine gamma-glutamyltransferase-like C-terminal domain-containing protein n=1 Tax=Costertonia aggregata TaxID=343403 RepID=A0A7H9ASF7_9FLAO|nr:DUF4129 domain-containing protein [Costertonia aggregata]QLG46421.1 hypothetical protein HYG79_14045 [Costertonia aggregata]